MEITTDDFVISNSGPLGSKYSLGSQDYGFLGEFDEMDEALLAFKCWCEANNWYPSLYFMSDHGNIDPIDSEGNIIEIDESE